MRQRTNSRSSRQVPAVASAAPEIMDPLPAYKQAAAKLLAHGDEVAGSLAQILQRELQDLREIKHKLLERNFPSTRRLTKRKLNSIHEDTSESMPKKKPSLEKVSQPAVENAPIENGLEMKDENKENTLESVENIDNIIMPPPLIPVKTKKNAKKACEELEITATRKSRRIKTMVQSTNDETTTTITRTTRSSCRMNNSNTVVSENTKEVTTTKKTRGRNKKKSSEKLADSVIIKEEIIEKPIEKEEEKTIVIEASKSDETVAHVVDEKMDTEEKHEIVINNVEITEVDAQINIAEKAPVVVEEACNEVAEMEVKNKDNETTIAFNFNINENNTSTPDKVLFDKEVAVDDADKKNDDITAVNTMLNATIVLEKFEEEDHKEKSEPVKEKKKKVALNETIVVIPDEEVPNNKKTDNKPCDVNGSLLPDDLSEVEETPPKVVVQKAIPLNKMALFESPVKSKVKHFEKLAEIANSKLTHSINQTGSKATRARGVKNSDLDDNPKISPENELSNAPKSNVKGTPNNLRKNLLKSNQPVPVISKQVGGATKFGSSNNINELMSPKGVSSSSQISIIKLKQEEAAAKREALKKKREEALRQVAKEREERLNRIEMEKKKALEKKLKAQEHLHEKMLKKKMEKKLEQQKEMENNDFNATRVISTNSRVSNFITHPNKAFDEMMKCDEDLEEKCASDSERKKAIEARKPQWAKKAHLDSILKYQRYISTEIRDTLYSTKIFSPDLTEIFPNIDRSKLKRTSSAVWKTPPRCSMMPRY